MTVRDSIIGHVTRHARVAALVYVGVTALFFVVIISSLLGVAGQWKELNQSREMLAQLRAHVHAAPAEAQLSNASRPPGSPFVEGPTVTLAEAALITRVTGAVTRAGGSVISSEVASRDDRSHAGHIEVIVSCEIEQVAMQRLIYDIESGMPFLFIDRLDADASSGPSKSIRLVLGVSGLWQSAK